MRLENTTMIHLNGITKILFDDDKVVIVDTDVAELMKPHAWTIHDRNDGRPYVRFKKTRQVGSRAFYLHRFVLGLHKEPAKHRDGVVDHINKNTLDNRRENLRIATNRANTIHRKNGNNGCSLCNKTYHWRAQIHLPFDKKAIHLGALINLMKSTKRT